LTNTYYLPTDRAILIFWDWLSREQTTTTANNGFVAMLADN